MSNSKIYNEINETLDMIRVADNDDVVEARLCGRLEGLYIANGMPRSDAIKTASHITSCLLGTRLERDD